MDSKASVAPGVSKNTASSQDAQKGHKNEPAGTNALPQKRVINKISTIDSKKFKELGIESNILSAMTKFSGKTPIS